MRLQPSNPQTWVALGEYDLQTNNPQEALNELRAAVYLNPETIAPEALISDDPELLEVRNAYLLALRETGGAKKNGGPASRRDPRWPWEATFQLFAVLHCFRRGVLQRALQARRVLAGR